ncbi:universal stress protein [Sorangium sp. So ce281]|uniref:universal stress protein n=1 Tax=unclassified Sorangium TaxID=2621164 RepID=UPI003F5F6AB0
MSTQAPAPARADQGRSSARTPHAAGDAPPETLPAGASEASAVSQAPLPPRAEPGRREPAGRAGGAAAAASAPAVVNEPAPASEARASVRGARRVQPYIVVVAMDLSEPGGRAWRFAFDLAALRGETEIHAVVIGPRQVAPAVRDVTTPGASSPPSLRVLQHRFADGQARLMAMHFRTGRPDRAIVALARELSADLIVVATHPQSPLQRLFGGSTADRIARNAPCPVVVVRPKEDDDADAANYDPRLR